MRRLSEPAARAQVFGPPGAAGGRGLRPDGVDRGVRACRQEPFAAERRRLRRGSAQGPGRGGLRSRERVEIAANSAPWRPCFRSGFCGQRPERGAELGLVAVEPERVDVDEAGEPPPLRQRAPDRTGERRRLQRGLGEEPGVHPVEHVTGLGASHGRVLLEVLVCALLNLGERVYSDDASAPPTVGL